MRNDDFTEEDLARLEKCIIDRASPKSKIRQEGELEFKKLRHLFGRLRLEIMLDILQSRQDAVIGDTGLAEYETNDVIWE